MAKHPRFSYVPDVANVSLDLLIDGESGVWNLVNGESLMPSLESAFRRCEQTRQVQAGSTEEISTIVSAGCVASVSRSGESFTEVK
jgi:hypothetical protein